MPLMETLYELQNAKKIELSPFWYTAFYLNSTMTALNPGVLQPISIQADSHFVVRYITCMTYVSAVSQPIMPNTGLAALTVNLVDTGSGRTLMDNPLSIYSVTGGVAAGGGNGSLPFILPEPLLLRASAVLQVTVANLSAVTFPRVELTFGGSKVFQFGGGAPPAL